jgi:threonyl-tRNA synthetase
MLPLWLSPTQVRVIPVSEDYVKAAVATARLLNRRGIRADVDDREETVPKKVRDAEREWIPYIIVMGEKEMTSNLLPVRVRRDGEIRNMTLDSLVDEIRRQVRGMPRRPLPLPMRVKERPRFVG